MPSPEMHEVQYSARAQYLIEALNNAARFGDEYDQSYIEFMWKCHKAFMSLPIADGEGVPAFPATRGR